MKKTSTLFLGPAEIAQINAAVAQAELTTSGEIKVLVVDKSSSSSTLKHIPFLKHVPKVRNIINRKVRERASKEFFNLGLDHTRDNTGVLIMISLKEKRVEVRAGDAIHNKVAQGTWQSITRTIIESIKSGHPAKGICRAIESTGYLLAEHFPRKADDTNEIPNEIVFKR